MAHVIFFAVIGIAALSTLAILRIRAAPTGVTFIAVGSVFAVGYAVWSFGFSKDR